MGLYKGDLKAEDELTKEQPDEMPLNKLIYNLKTIIKYKLLKWKT